MHSAAVTDTPSLLQRAQTFGRLLSRMITPNIGAYIAWGLLTALFAPGGWTPNAQLAQLLQPMLFYLLPLLIGYTGGHLLHGQRGGVLGAIMTLGAIVGTSTPMIFGAMVTGPLAGALIRALDGLVRTHPLPGFDMLLSNFAAGLLGCTLAVVALVGVGPALEWASLACGRLVQTVVDAGVLPLAALVIEPAKVLFLNNAINHGVLSPLGLQQAAESGRSLLFLLETNPGPGLGVLLAYWLFGRAGVRHSAAGALVIHGLGGIHEIYFPYVLMQPRLLLAVIAGGATGIATFSALGAGLVGVPSPGSLITLVAMTPGDSLTAVLAGVSASTLVSFSLAAALIKRGRSADRSALLDATATMNTLKGKQVPLASAGLSEQQPEQDPTLKPTPQPAHQPAQQADHLPAQMPASSALHTIAIACDAGMGSSVLGATKLRSALGQSGAPTNVVSCPIDELDPQVDLVICHERLSRRARAKAPRAVHIAITDFLQTPLYAELAEYLRPAAPQTGPAPGGGESEPAPLPADSIRLGLAGMERDAAIRLAGSLLQRRGCVDGGYIDAMLERERECSTYVGNGVAIPHGTAAARKLIHHTGLSLLQFPEGIDFDGKPVYLVIALAALGDHHLMLLAQLADALGDPERVARLRSTDDPGTIIAALGGAPPAR